MSNIETMRKMQDAVVDIWDQHDEKEFTVTAADGMIELTMNGNRELKSVKLNPEIVDKDDIDGLQDIIITGVNAVIQKVDDDLIFEMEKITGGVSAPSCLII